MKTLKKNDRIIIIFYVFLAISFTVGVLYIDSTFETTTLPDLTPKIVTELEIIKEVEIDRDEIFLIMTDLKNYPIVLPKNIKSVQIIEDIDNEILAEYEVFEAGIYSKLIVQHTIYPYYEHTMEVMDGDAKGTKITQKFTETNSITTIHTIVELDLKGILSPFGFLPKSNLDHAANTIVTSFIDYSQMPQNETNKIIDDLYREILFRPADIEAFEHWGSLLEKGSMTVDEIRTQILNSDESLAYIKYYSKNNELVIQIFHEVYELNGPYYEGRSGELFFDPRLDRSSDSKLKELEDTYKYLLDVEEITLDEVRSELQQLKENGVDFFVNDLDSVDEQFSHWKGAFQDEDYDFCYSCKY